MNGYYECDERTCSYNDEGVCCSCSDLQDPDKRTDCADYIEDIVKSDRGCDDEI